MDSEDKVVMIDKEDMVALPGYTKDRIDYVSQCQTCRKKRSQRIYLGESSRSGNQRVQEHCKDIQDGIITHPMVVHFIEEHGGEA